MFRRPPAPECGRDRAARGRRLRAPRHAADISAASHRSAAPGRSADTAASVARRRAAAPIRRTPVRPLPMAASVRATSMALEPPRRSRAAGRRRRNPRLRRTFGAPRSSTRQWREGPGKDYCEVDATVSSGAAARRRAMSCETTALAKMQAARRIQASARRDLLRAAKRQASPIRGRGCLPWSARADATARRGSAAILRSRPGKRRRRRTRQPR